MPSPTQQRPAQTRARVEEALAGLGAAYLEPRDGTLCVELAREALHEAARRLRDDAGFAAHTFTTAIDHLPAEPRYALYHQLLSVEHGDRVRLVVRLGSDDAWVPTLVDLWPGASFCERECWDLFGIRFEGHPDLRRLMMPEGYEHHPLRKDFPHRGIEPDRLYREWDERRRARSPLLRERLAREEGRR